MENEEVAGWARGALLVIALAGISSCDRSPAAPSPPAGQPVTLSRVRTVRKPHRTSGCVASRVSRQDNQPRSPSRRVTGSSGFEFLVELPDRAGRRAECRHDEGGSRPVGATSVPARLYLLTVGAGEQATSSPASIGVQAGTEVVANVLC